MALNEAMPANPRYVPYMNLGGGLNTKKDSHAISRNQLAALINGWYAYGDVLSKRPGSTPYVTSTGATGSGGAGNGIAVGRFSNASVAVIQQGTQLYYARPNDVAYTLIGSLASSPGPIRAAQMYDPSTGKESLFIVDGAETPKIWAGPGGTFTAATVPQNGSNTAPITPKFVATVGNNSHLFYAGEPSYPTGVFISDSFYPQSFTGNAPVSSGYPGTYAPYVVGLNDGVNGGDITGLEPLGSMMLVYKQAAIYRMIQVGLYGQMLWSSELVSGSVGCLSPRSIVRFDTFHCFLGIDGVYQTDGNTTRCISANVPTYFDSTLSGNAAIIADRTSAVAARIGNRYCIWFDDGSGVPSRGLWFDFNKLDEDGLPCVGEIQGMKVAGMVALRGPQDDGTAIWVDAAQDRVGKFGLGFADFSNPITLQFFGKADFMDDVFGPEAPLMPKAIDNIQLLVALPQTAANEALTFSATVITDLLASYTQAAPPLNVNAPASGQWGQNWGAMVWSQTGGTTQYQTAKIYARFLPQSQGRVVQIGIVESSVYPVNVLGYLLYLNAQEVAA